MLHSNEVYDDYSTDMDYPSTTPPPDHLDNITVQNDGFMFDSFPLPVFYGVYGPIFVLGFLGNGMLVFIIAFHKKMRTVPNLYILNLSVASMIIILGSAFRYFLDNRDFVPVQVCAATQIVKRSSMFVTVYTLVALSMERYHAIRYPLRGNSGEIAAFVSRIIILFIWMFSLTLTAIRVISNDPTCLLSKSKMDLRGVEQMYSYVEFFLTYLIPLLITGTFYILTARELYLAGRSTDGDHVHQRLMEVKKKMVWVGLVLAVIYAVVYLPLYMIRLFKLFEFKFNWKTAANVCGSLLNIQPCLTPVILYSFSEPCRRHMKHYLYKWICRSLAPLDSLYSESESANRHHGSMVRRDQATTAV